MSAEPTPEPTPEPVVQAGPFSILDSLVVDDTKRPQFETRKHDDEVPRPIETTIAPTAPVLSPKASENFRKLEASKQAAEQERDSIKGQLETFKAQIAEREKKIADLESLATQRQSESGNLTGLQLTVDEQAQQIRALQQELKAADIKRDPEFQDKFIHTKKFQEDLLADVASLVQVPKEHVHQALRMGDEGKLSEIREALPPQQQRRWDAALIKREQIDQEREQAEQNADKTWEQLQKGRAEQAKNEQAQIAARNRAVSKQVMNSIFEQAPDLRQNQMIVGQLSSIADAISGVGPDAKHWTPDKIIEAIMMGQVHQTATQFMDKIIEEQKEKLKTSEAERKKLEGFLKGRGIPYSDTAGFQGEPEKKNGYDPKSRLVDSIQIARR